MVYYLYSWGAALLQYIYTINGLSFYIVGGSFLLIIWHRKYAFDRFFEAGATVKLAKHHVTMTSGQLLFL